MNQSEYQDLYGWENTQEKHSLRSGRSDCGICFEYEGQECRLRLDQAAWGGYIRYNKLLRLIYDRSGDLLREEFLFAYHVACAFVRVREIIQDF